MSQRANTTLALSALALAGVWLVSEIPEAPTLSQPPDQAQAVQAAPAPPQARSVDEQDIEEDAEEALPPWLTLSRRPQPRRLPYRPSVCTNPPPGGTWQVATIAAAREHDCGEALSAWSRAMEASEDHCPLARTVWLCFNETNQRSLQEKTFRDFEELVPWLVHLEGKPKARIAIAAALRKTHAPAWSWPAADGLEHRLEAFAADEVLQESVIDLFGEPTVADHLATDLLIEAEIAVALAKLSREEHFFYSEEVWARRVYVVADALYGPAGALIQNHRKDLYAELRRLVEEAVEGAPETVRRAHAVARRDEALDP